MSFSQQPNSQLTVIKLGEVSWATTHRATVQAHRVSVGL